MILDDEQILKCQPYGTKYVSDRERAIAKAQYEEDSRPDSDIRQEERRETLIEVLRHVNSYTETKEWVNNELRKLES